MKPRKRVVGKGSVQWLDAMSARSIRDGYCPDCGHRGFVMGPMGSMMHNIECGNVKCRSRFNAAFPWLDSAQMLVHRIDRQDDGGADWGKPIR